MILGDQGADVIKVEAPDGDSIRSAPTGAAGSGGFLNKSQQALDRADLKNPAALGR
jgi:crotonobetainyl-CoA:carnitine CoA-transferase CaiB-like acyl-CoA transferase